MNVCANINKDTGDLTVAFFNGFMQTGLIILWKIKHYSADLLLY
jgi:hypothetical protein